jgi:hypothetical protein
MTIQDARKYTAGIGLYIMQEGNEGSPVSALETCAAFVQLQSSRENGRAHSSIPPISLTVGRHMCV